MKQALSDVVRAKEAAFWGNIKKMLVQNPGKACKVKGVKAGVSCRFGNQTGRVWRTAPLASPYPPFLFGVPPIGGGGWGTEDWGPGTGDRELKSGS